MEDILKEDRLGAWAFRVSALVVFLFIAILLFQAINRVRADSVPLPSKMESAEAADLDRSLSHIKDLQLQMVPWVERATVIAKKYRFELKDLGQTVGIDFISGEITRKHFDGVTK